MPRDARAVVVHEEKLRQVVNVGQHMRAAAARGCEVAEGDGAMVCVYGGLRDRVHAEGRLTNAMCRQEALWRMDVTHSCNVRKSREIECVEDVHRGCGVHKQQKPWAHLGSNVQVCVKYKERFNNEKNRVTRKARQPPPTGRSCLQGTLRILRRRTRCRRRRCTDPRRRCCTANKRSRWRMTQS